MTYKMGEIPAEHWCVMVVLTIPPPNHRPLYSFSVHAIVPNLLYGTPRMLGDHHTPCQAREMILMRREALKMARNMVVVQTGRPSTHRPITLSSLHAIVPNLLHCTAMMLGDR